MPEEKETPFGILLISTYYIFIATYFFILINLYSNTSYYSFGFIMVLTLLGIFFIMAGWGVLTLKKWAYYTTIAISILSIFFSFFSVGAIFYLYSILFFLINLILQAMVVIYIIPRSEIFGIESSVNLASITDLQNFYRICPDCSKNIPFDSDFCPYCGKKFINYFEKN